MTRALRPFVFALLLAALIVVVFRAGQANAWTREPTVSAVASIFAMRPVSVRCFDPAEPDSPAAYDAWGYVKKPLGRARYAAVDGDLCFAALNINDTTVDSVSRALGVLVVVHESYHLRRWGAAGNEAKVECQAIRHWKVGARLLGASEATVSELWGAALALHYEETSIVDIRTGTRPYYDETCRVPTLSS